MSKHGSGRLGCFQVLLQVFKAIDESVFPFGIARMKRGKKVKKKVHSTLKRDLEARAKSEHYRYVLISSELCFEKDLIVQGLHTLTRQKFLLL